jgi:hypothetical protein
VVAELPKSPSRTSLFSSLHALDTAIFSASTARVVVALTLRCIDALDALLVRAISAPPISKNDPTPREALNGIERVLPRILRAAISALQGAYIDPWNAIREDSIEGVFNDSPTMTIHEDNAISALDFVLGRVATQLLLPTIRALARCTVVKTEHILLSLIKSPLNEEEFADGTDLLSLVGATLDAIADLERERECEWTVKLHDRIALEVVRALTSLIVDDRPSPAVPLTTPVAAAQRVHRIARKDALYFLCDAALLALRRSVPVPPAPAGKSREEMLLRSALSEALGNLALTLTQTSSSLRGSGLDVVEVHRVMAVLERAWSVGLRVGHIPADEASDADMDLGQDEVGRVVVSDRDGEERERAIGCW